MRLVFNLYTRFIVVVKKESEGGGGEREGG